MRPDHFVFYNGEKAPLPFSDNEYENRLTTLRAVMSEKNIDAILEVVQCFGIGCCRF